MGCRQCAGWLVVASSHFELVHCPCWRLGRPCAKAVPVEAGHKSRLGSREWVDSMLGPTKILAFAVVGFALLFQGAAVAGEASRLDGRTLDVLVGFSNTGGGANFWRVFSEALKRHLPGTTVRARFDDTLSGAQVTTELFALPR